MSQYSDFEEEEFQAQITGKTLGRILALAKPHWKWVAGFLVGIAFVSMIDAYFTFLTKQIIDNGILAHNISTAQRAFLTYGGLILLQALFVFGFIYMVGILGERIRFDLRQTMFNHLQELSLSYFSRRQVGWIMARVTSDSDRVADLMTWGMLDTTWAVINVITAAYFMLIINAKMALIVFTVLPILIYVAIYFRKKILLQYRNVRRLNSQITGAFNENITGVRVVKALSREDENLREFSNLTGQMYSASFRAAWLSALFLPTVQIISAVALGFIIWFGGKQVQFGTMTIGGIQAFISYITFMLWPIQDMARIYAEMQHAIASAERMFSLIDTVPEVQDRADAIDPGTVKGEINFDHVDFYYEADKPVLKDFTLNVKPGETVALVGPTGGGKTTIVNLLCRFYEPKKGKISIGGRDYMDLNILAIQSRIGIVLQTPHLFSGTIKENIRYGRLDASEDDIFAAAKIAGAHDFITTLEKSYDQEVGEGGNMLSVGQKQLISLARAVLANPEIFIMDEATSSVDTLTEALIQRGMENLMKGRTSFIIAHRLSTIKRSNKIVVIDNGQIAEMGSHTELMKVHGHYYRLYTQQFRHKLETDYDPFQTLATPQISGELE
jgi:ATP-binding cassette, subfamily B, bacterial